MGPFKGPVCLKPSLEIKLKTKGKNVCVVNGKKPEIKVRINCGMDYLVQNNQEEITIMITVKRIQFEGHKYCQL